MATKIDLLLDAPCPELLCGLCLDVLEDPTQVHCPEDHMFCSKCIYTHVEQQQSVCPVCLTNLDKSTFQLSKFVQRQIGRLLIKCKYAKNGCPWQGLISDLHECRFKSITCPNAENGCDSTNLSNSNIQQHLEECLYQMITCPNNMPLCQPFLRKDIDKHENECQSYTCSYVTEGCSFMGTLSQVNHHVEDYCGRLHKKVDELESEVARLNKLIHDFTLGLQIKLPSTPETQIQEDKQRQQQQSLDQLTDTSMDEMSLFNQIFSADAFGALDLNASTPTNIISPTAKLAEQEDAITEVKVENNFMDLGFLDSMNSNYSENLFDTATSPQPLQFIPPTNAPKRASNGKKIKYSKNIRLAYGALRMARQRTASNSNTNPSNDAILNNFNTAKQQQQLQQQSNVLFENIDHVTQFLNDNTTDMNNINTIPSNNIKKKQKPIDTSTSTAIAVSNKQTTSSSSSQSLKEASSPPSTLVPKRRPMFILASSYLSNYSTNDKK